MWHCAAIAKFLYHLRRQAAILGGPMRFDEPEA
jgi:hypothetical protein